MIGFILSRLLQAIPVLIVVGFISFAMFAFVGDPVTIMLGQDYTEAQRVRLVHELGLDQPFFVQYAKFMWKALHGEFGVSYRLARPRSAASSWSVCPPPPNWPPSRPCSPWSSACRWASTPASGAPASLSRLVMIFSLLGVSLPTFLIGILLILVFAVLLGWLPSFGRGDVVHFLALEHRLPHLVRPQGAGACRRSRWGCFR